MSEEKAAVKRRLRTIAGHIQAVERMVDEDKYCIDIANQLAAAEAILRKTQREIMRAHLDGCVRAAFKAGDEQRLNAQIEEILSVLDTLGK